MDSRNYESVGDGCIIIVADVIILATTTTTTIAIKIVFLPI